MVVISHNELIAKSEIQIKFIEIDEEVPNGSSGRVKEQDQRHPDRFQGPAGGPYRHRIVDVEYPASDLHFQRQGRVGKTNIVANLALALTRLGKKVLVLDADLGLANIDILLALSPRYTIEHLLNGQKRLQDILVPGPEGMGDPAGRFRDPGTGRPK